MMTWVTERCKVLNVRQSRDLLAQSQILSPTSTHHHHHHLTSGDHPSADTRVDIRQRPSTKGKEERA
jgi:hypothetical protein